MRLIADAPRLAVRLCRHLRRRAIRHTQPAPLVERLAGRGNRAFPSLARILRGAQENLFEAPVTVSGDRKVTARHLAARVRPSCESAIRHLSGEGSCKERTFIERLRRPDPNRRGRRAWLMDAV